MNMGNHQPGSIRHSLSLPDFEYVTCLGTMNARLLVVHAGSCYWRLWMKQVDDWIVLWSPSVSHNGVDVPAPMQWYVFCLFKVSFIGALLQGRRSCTQPIHILIVPTLLLQRWDRVHILCYFGPQRWDWSWIMSTRVDWRCRPWITQHELRIYIGLLRSWAKRDRGSNGSSISIPFAAYGEAFSLFMS